MLKKLQQQAKVLRKEKHAGIRWDEKTKIKQQTSLTMQLEMINQKIWRKKNDKKMLEQVQAIKTKQDFSI